jgi:hypothetical protein
MKKAGLSPAPIGREQCAEQGAWELSLDTAKITLEESDRAVNCTIEPTLRRDDGLRVLPRTPRP